MASATDEGGSIRMPASACGIFGLKPSRGRNPIGPDFMWDFEGQSTSHVVSWSVRDTAAMLDAVCGAELGSPHDAPPQPEHGFLGSLDRAPAKLRIGVSTDRKAFGIEMEPPCVQGVVETAKLLEDLGHEVVEVQLPYDEMEVLRAFIMLASAHTAALVRALEERHGSKSVRTQLEEPVRFLAAMGRSIPGEAPAIARQTGLRIGHALANSFAEVDLLVTPTLGRVPVPLEQADTPASDRRLLGLLASSVGERLLGVPALRETVMSTQLQRLADQVLQRTMVANLTGVPAMSVPLHDSPDGLPVGIQFMGPLGEEAKLLRLAAQLEEARPWRRPPSPFSQETVG